MHLSTTRQFPSTGRSVIPRYSAATQKKSPICAKKITIFPVFMNKTQILLFALAATAASTAATAFATWPLHRGFACVERPSILNHKYGATMLAQTAATAASISSISS